MIFNSTKVAGEFSEINCYDQENDFWTLASIYRSLQWYNTRNTSSEEEEVKREDKEMMMVMTREKNAAKG